MFVCSICGERRMRGSRAKVVMCDLCARSYDKTLGGDMASALVWAAARARRFERTRGARGLSISAADRQILRVLLEADLDGIIGDRTLRGEPGALVLARSVRRVLRALRRR